MPAENLYSQTDTSNIKTNNIAKDSVKEKSSPKNKKFIMSKSPMGAVWRSLLLPGLGQIYVKRYWKAPIFTASCGFLTYLIIDNNQKFNEKADLVEQLKRNNSNDPNIFIEKRYREYYRDNRDMSAFYLLAAYIIAAVDCYADAHLFDFNIDDKLSLNLAPGRLGNINLNFSLKF